MENLFENQMKRFSFSFAVLTILVRRRTKTQKYKGALFEHSDYDSNNLRAIGPNHAQLKTKQNRKQDNRTRHSDQNKVNE